MKKSVKILLVLFFSLTLFVGVAHFAVAQVQPFGGGAQQSIIQNALGLGAQDPRVTAAKIISVALGFLGIIAIGLVLYGGWLWLTSGGEASKIERAKKLLISAGIGLIIILSAWGIVTFILSALLNATGAPGVCTPACLSGEYCCSGSCSPVPCTSGSFCSPACSGTTPFCCSGICSATACITPPCIGPACPGTPCDSNTLTPICDPDNTMCAADQYCNTSSCFCLPTGGVGDPCDADTGTAVCEPNPLMCSAYLDCDAGSCTCEGAPVIQWVSLPDGAVGNFVTIGGRYFGTTTGAVYFSDATGSTTVLAQFPDTVNPACISNWSDTQIIVVVPGGTAALSAIRVARADGQQDETDDARGPAIDDFIINSTVRPGLCLASPATGVFGAGFTVQGNNFSGVSRDVFFGKATASTSADNVVFVSALTATALIPNLRAGGSTIFANVDGENSNVLNFYVTSDPNNDPVIDYIDPAEGPEGQYITIYGRNFKNYLVGTSIVTFENGGPPIPADIDFPAACSDKWWRDRYIIVKVPSISTGPWQVSVTNQLSIKSNLADFSVTTGSPGPGLCALTPYNGPVGQAVTASGDYFGTTAGTARFYNNQPGLVSGWANQSVNSLVPAGAETGPFRIVNTAGDISNSINFTVGKCSASSDCEAGDECCDGGTFDGICRAAGSCGDGTAAACTFAWTFTTTVSTSTPATCAGYSGAAACLAAGSCPNSPGQCQTSTTTTFGACGDANCNSTNPICGGACEYDGGINKCKLTGSYCDQTDDTLVAGYTAECRRVGTAGRWQINSGSASCPLGTFQDTNGWCSVGVPGSPVVCDICVNGFTCQTNECAINKNICPVGSSCDLSPSSPTVNICVSSAPTCECCCRVANSAQDCCAGLTCEAGGCGNDPLVYGQCIGCRVELDGNIGTFDAAEADASDAACNCTPGPATRFCDISSDALGVCEDLSAFGGPCRAPTLNGPFTTVTQATMAWDDGYLLFQATSSTSTTYYVVNPADNPSCNPLYPVCLPGLYCGASCKCETIPGNETYSTENSSGPGSRCIDLAAPTCNLGEPTCITDYTCLNNSGTDCRCCCTPGDINLNGLVCQADKSPCDGGSRGLYCGCVDDIECGAVASIGCSPIDTCCRDRPAVQTVEPADLEIDVCRNPLLTATFDQEMDIKSFTGNVIVVGDYGTDQCPAGTNYLTGGIYKKYNFFGKLWFNLSRLFTKSALAIPGNFCAVTGLVKGYNNSSGEGILTFAPTNVLDGDRTYYAIIKGDNSATASTSEGVLSRFGIGMASPNSEEFNSITYNGFIWSFRTKVPTADDDGICRLEYVEIDPASYLFQSTQNDTADDGLGNALDASTVDRDKQFNAFAKSRAGENIVPIPAVYSWDWVWISENESVARLGASSSPASITPAALIVEAQNKKDAKTYLKVNATITADSINTPSTINKIKSAKAPIYVFICENPWPPVIDPADWPWQDADNNCTQEIATCLDNNFELYYCRDSASVGTANDLPTILVNPVVRGTPAAPNQPLKELFFLREELPGQASLTVTDQLDGTRVYADWPAVASVTSYKLYYGSASRTYSEVVETTATNYMVSGLVTGRKYYFAVTAIFAASRTESQQSVEVEITPTDTTPPPVPAGFSASSTDRAVDLSWTLNSTSDTVGYYIYYGTSAGSYGAREAVNNSTNQATITGLTNGVNYYFMLGAYDKAGNEATTSSECSRPGELICL